MPWPKVFKREGTKSSFSPRGKARHFDLDKPEETKRTTKRDEVVEDHTEEQQDKEVQKDAGRSEEADKHEEPRKVKDKKVVDRNEALVKPRTDSDFSAPVYSLIWNRFLNYTLAPRERHTTAYFIPNAMAMFEMLKAANELVGQSTRIQKHEKEYCEYAVATGYAILYYIQILRAKRAAKSMTGLETSLLKRFTADHPEESIDIAEPMFPYFNTIVATELEDRKYEWVVPSYSANGTASIGQEHIYSYAPGAHGLEYIMPNVPMMLAMLAAFGSEVSTTIQAKIDDENRYVPLDIQDAGTATPIFGHTAAPNELDFDNSAMNDAHMLLAICGVSYPFRFQNDNASVAVTGIWNSKFFGPGGISHRAASTTGMRPRTKVGVNFTEDYDSRGIEKFLHMEKKDSIEWFSYIKDQMTIFARHWSKVYNLSQVNDEGGLTSAVIGKMRTYNTHAEGTNHRYVYANQHLGLTRKDQASWYPSNFEQMTCSFKTTRAGVDRDEELTAFAFAINSTPPLHTADFRQQSSGDFFRDGVDETIAQEIGEEDTLIKGPIPLFRGLKTDVCRKIFKPEPLGSRG